MTDVILNIDLLFNGLNKLVANKKLIVHFRELGNNIFFASEKKQISQKHPLQAHW
jgi:hypothetical protein